MRLAGKFAQVGVKRDRAGPSHLYAANVKSVTWL
jgi:hypothetical protein